jgi:hypothetical protein
MPMLVKQEIDRRVARCSPETVPANSTRQSSAPVVN